MESRAVVFLDEQARRLRPRLVRRPMHFSKGMAGAGADRPIAIRFVDERTLANSLEKTKSVQ